MVNFKSLIEKWFIYDHAIYKYSDGQCRKNLLNNSEKLAKATVIES